MFPAADGLHDGRVHQDELGAEHSVNAVTREVDLVQEIRQWILGGVDVPLSEEKPDPIAKGSVEIDYWIVLDGARPFGGGDKAGRPFGIVITIFLSIPANSKGPPTSSNVRRMTSIRIFI